jgi:predicted Fe-Mo cluster-binding NifX family protein
MNQTNPIQALKNKGIKITQPNVKEELEYVIKKVAEENRKASMCQPSSVG